MIRSTIFLFASMLLLSACNRDEIQAISSLEGDWTVTGITSYYGDFTGNGFNPTETVEENGQLGNMDFGKDSVSYAFTRNDTLYSGTARWTLSEEKVNEGFFRVPAFTLTIGDEWVFDVAFGDQTKNAERNATNILLTSERSGSALADFQLEKN